jgi:hypothetical protein
MLSLVEAFLEFFSGIESKARHQITGAESTPFSFFLSSQIVQSLRWRPVVPLSRTFRSGFWF